MKVTQKAKRPRAVCTRPLHGFLGKDRLLAVKQVTGEFGEFGFVLANKSFNKVGAVDET